MANISPGVYTKVIDLSAFVQMVPGTVGFICALTEKGEDNKVKFKSSPTDFIDEYGEPNISQFGFQYGQGPYVAYNYLGESGALKFMRCLPDDATYANLRIYGNTDASSVYFIDYVSDLNNTTDITNAMQSWGNNTPLVIFYPIGRGEYYNKLGISITEDAKYPGEGIYHLDIYETQSNGDYVMIESFMFSFDESAKSPNPGESIFLEYVLDTYSKVLRAEVSDGGFSLLEKVYYDTRLGSGGGTRSGGPTGETGEYDYDGDITITSVGRTTYIDTTTVEHITTYLGDFWATTSDMVQPMTQSGAIGTIGSALLANGFTAGISGARTALAWYWDGSTWATTTTSNYYRYEISSCGDPDGDAIFACGDDSDSDYHYCDKWDGSTWATTTASNHVKKETPVLVGTFNDAILSGGGTVDAQYHRQSERWDGSTWTLTSSLNQFHSTAAGFGDSTSLIICAGETTSYAIHNGTERWSYSYPTLYTWTTTSSMVRVILGPAGFGTQNDTLSSGGESSGWQVYSEIWNGSSWATTTNCITPSSYAGSFGTTSSGLRFGGDTTGIGASNKTDIWNGSAWASTTAFSLESTRMKGLGTSATSGMSVGGSNWQGVVQSLCYKWNGSTWSGTSGLTSARCQQGTAGSTTSGLSIAGSTNGISAYSTLCDVWNGSTWATTTAYLTAFYELSSSHNASTTDVRAFGGRRVGDNYSEYNYSWNGSTWSTTSSLNYGKAGAGGSGTSNALSLSFGGSTGSVSNITEKTTTSPVEVGAWTTTSTMNTARAGHGAAGTEWHSGIAFAGNTTYDDLTTILNSTERWDGSIWSTTNSMNLARTKTSGVGTSHHALGICGDTANDNTRSASTEIWYPKFQTTTVVHHHEVPVIVDIYQITDTAQDFSPYETDPESGDASYVIIVSDSNNKIIWGWLGDSTGVGNITINVWKDKDLDTGTRGWNGDTGTFTYDDTNLTYIIKSSYDATGLGIPGLFSVRPLKKGTEGSLISSGSLDTDVATQILAQGYAGQIDDDVLDVNSEYFNLIYDAGYPKDVKDQIVGLAQSREDSVAIIDIGDNNDTASSISDRRNNYPYNTYYASLFSPYGRVFDIWTERQVWFAPSYHMAYILPRNDRVGELWFAAAGNNRGVCRNIQELRYSPNRSQRDLLYLDQINPIIQQNNSYMLWGQLTSQSKASALQDLNIVRLILYIQTALKQFSNSFIFEQNDPLTWNAVKIAVIDFLEQIKKKRGLFGYTVSVEATPLELKNKTFHINIILEPIKTVEKIEINIFVR